MNRVIRVARRTRDGAASSEETGADAFVGPPIYILDSIYRGSFLSRTCKI